MKRAMQQRKDTNWSEVLRERIREVLARRKRENKVKALLMAQKLYRPAPEGWDSTHVIRFWRDRRYGKVRDRR